MARTRWNGQGDGRTWTEPANWAAGVPATGIDAVFATGQAETVRLAGAHATLDAGALLVHGDTLTLTDGALDLAPAPAKQGNTFDLVVDRGAEVTVKRGTRLSGSNVAEIGNGTGGVLTVAGQVAEEYGVVQSGTLDVRAGHWLSGDSGLYLNSSTLVVEGGGRIDTGGRLADFPAAALDIEGTSTASVAGAGSVIHLQNVFLSDQTGTSTLMIEAGGQVFSGGGTIGGDGDATLTVSGPGSLFKASRGLTIGGQVPVNSRLVVQDGGSVVVGRYGMVLDGTLALDGSASVRAPQIVSGGGIIDATAGAVSLSADLALYDNASDPFETGTTYLEAVAGATLTLAGRLRSAVSGDTGKTLNAASGHIVLAHGNADFAGTTAIYSATLEIAAAGAAGTGGLAFIGGSHDATLTIDGDHPFGNVIAGFGAADTIDLAGFDFGHSDPTIGWTGNASGGTLTLTDDAGQQRTLLFAGSDLSAASFGVAHDGQNGVEIVHV